MFLNDQAGDRTPWLFLIRTRTYVCSAVSHRKTFIYLHARDGIDEGIVVVGLPVHAPGPLTIMLEEDLVL